MTPPASASAALSPAPTWRRWRRGLAGLSLLAVMIVGLREGWLTPQRGTAPTDWAGFWTGDRSDGPVTEGVVPLASTTGQLVVLDGDVTFQSPGRPGTEELIHLGRWTVGPRWTLAGWFRIESWPANDAAFSPLAGSGREGFPGLGIVQRSPVVMIGPTNGGFRLVAGRAFELGRWTHLAVVGSPDRLRLFVDGQPAGEQVMPANAPPALPPGESLLQLGAGADGQPFRRQADDLAVYGRALEGSEIARLQALGRSGLSRHLQQRATTELARQQRWAQGVRWALAVGAMLATVGMIPGLRAWTRRPLGPLRGRTLRQFAAAWGVLLLGLGLTGAAYAWTRAWVHETARHRLEHEAQSIRRDLDAYFERLVTTLQLLRERALAGPDPVAKDWWRQLLAVNLKTDFPAVTLCAYAELVWPEERTERERHWNTHENQQYQGFFRIFPELPASRRNPHFHDLTNCFLPLVMGELAGPSPRPITVHDFLGRDLLALAGGSLANDNLAHRIRGLLGSKPRSFAVSALELDQQLNLTNCVAVGVPATWPKPPFRHDERRGTVVAVVHLPRLFAGAFGQRAPDFGMRLSLAYQNTDIALPVFDSGDLWRTTREPVSPWLRAHEDTPLYQSRLRCDFWTTPEFDRNSHRHAPWLVALAGTAFTLLAAGFVAVQVRARLLAGGVAENLQRLNAELAAATRERARLSRDLHDGTIQNLYALGLEIGQARALVRTAPERADAELGHSLAALQTALAELRQFVLELEPESWSGQSVRSALEALVSRLRRTTTSQFTVSLTPAAEHLPARTAIQVLQLAREGLSNVLRHARATKVWVRLERSAPESVTPPEWTLEIGDDGAGFEVPAQAANGGRGLRSFRERAAELNGTCDIHSAPGTGTRVVIRFPDPPPP